MSYPGGHLLFVYLSLMALEAAALSFHYNFSIPGHAEDLTYINDSYIGRNRIELTYNIKGKGSVGRVAYRQPVRLWDSVTGRVANFTTSFTFAIGGNRNNTRGDGMAFFVGPFPPTLPPYSLNEYLGLFSNPNKTTEPSPPTVAVEFDTWHNADVDAPGTGAGPDHFGIDVNNISSISSKELANLSLYGNMRADIVYDAGSKLMTVNLRLADGSTYRDQATVDFREAGLPQDAAVGFSAAMGTFSESHELLSWSFNSTEVADHPTTDPSSKTKSWVIMVLYIGCPLIAVLLAALACIIYYRRKRLGIPMREMPPVAREFSYKELRAATHNFSVSNKIGTGPSGDVFRGVLCGQLVAVKQRTLLSEETRKDYITEVRILDQVNHRNLVKLVGWGDGGSKDKLLLIYELITNRNLHEHLYSSEGLLTWLQRYKIVLGIGHGIKYLHTGYQNIILYRDIKPSNVMLDDAFEAKICHFWLTRQVDPGHDSLCGTPIIGSIDYMDPALMANDADMCTVGPASDIYCFGVLLLEVATGKKSRITVHGERILSNALINDVRDAHAKGTVIELADMRLNGHFDRNQMERVLSVGLLCVQPNPKDRPPIRDVVDLLSNLTRPVPQMVDGIAPPKVAHQISHDLHAPIESKNHRSFELDLLQGILGGREEPSSLKLSLLQDITKTFSPENKIGHGGCGEVYKGFLPDGNVVAVKRLFTHRTLDDKMFQEEVTSMLKLKHQNIVRLLGYCSDTQGKVTKVDEKFIVAEERERLLCFEYIKKGSLAKYLTEDLSRLDWCTRYQIIKGICDGLHHLWENRTLHMDLKPDNILIDDNMVPKITDFGLARADEKSVTMSADRLISPGYCAPEYIGNGKRSNKSDMYSLGIIMLEIVTGSKESPNKNNVLERWRKIWNNSSKSLLLWHEQVTKCLELALQCIQENPECRPSILDVICELK